MLFIIIIITAIAGYCNIKPGTLLGAYRALAACDIIARGKYVLLDLKSAACRNNFLLLRQSEGQDAVSVACVDSIGINAGDIKAAAEGTVETLALYEVLLLVFLVVVDLALCADCEAIILDVDLNVLFLEAGQFSLELECIAGIGNVGTECGDNIAVVEEAALKIIQLTERIIVAHVANGTIKRNKFKHNIYLQIIYY